MHADNVFQEEHFGASTECPSYKQSNERNRERKGPTVDVRFTEIPFLYKFPLRQSPLYQRQKMGNPNLEKSLHGNKKIISRIMRTPPCDQSLRLSS